MIRVLVIITILLSLGSSPLYASMEPQALVKETSQLMLAKLRDEKEQIKTNPERIYELVNEIIIPHFDFEYMSQMVLAKYWRTASEKQRQAFTEQFKQLLVRTYATSLNEYADREITYLPFRSSTGKTKVTVKTEVDQPGGFPIPIDYQLRTNSSDWKVFDVVIEGVSLVLNYRTSFANDIHQNGLDSLIETLTKRNKEATGE